MVDDGSTDSSGSICDKYAANDIRFRVIHKKNGGVASARNAAMPYVCGLYTMFLDSDDSITSDLLKYFVNAAQTRKVDVIQVQYTRDIEKLGGFDEIELVGGLSKGAVYEDILKFQKVSPIVNSKLYVTDSIKEYRFNEKCYVLEDVEFITKVMMNASWYIDNYIGYYYRPTPGSLITQGLNMRKLQGSMACQNSCISMLDVTSLKIRSYEFKYNSLFNWLIRTAKQENWTEFYQAIKKGTRNEIRLVLKCKKLGIKAKMVLLMNMISPMIAHFICRQK